MVAKITFPKSISRALNYNEQKVQKGLAECVYAQKFVKHKDSLQFQDKLGRFNELNKRNERAKTNTLHISLNFDPSENLSKKKLIEIATTYMEKIGFSDQPYLVYQHRDAGHPHVHIVTTNIKTDGTRINTHNIGRNQSETARKEIEKDFGLVQAGRKHYREINKIPAIDSGKVIYGKSETKRAITNVLDAVLNQYKYTSLTELNAILKQYNVLADRGEEKSRTYKSGGLYYRVLDKEGNKVGVPIKASSIYSKPTLAELEKRFPQNELSRKPHRASVKERIDQALQKPASIQDFVETLNKKNIDVVFRQNTEGRLYGITFVDHKTKSVFNGSDLGKEYSAAAISEKLRDAVIHATLRKMKEINTGYPQRLPRPTSASQETQQGKETLSAMSTSPGILQTILQPEKDFSQTSYGLIKKKRKKKKRKL